MGLLVLAGLCASAGAQLAPVDYNNRGIDAYNKGRFQDAIANFEKAYEGARDNDAVRHNLCNARQSLANELAKQTDFAGAVKELELAIGVTPDEAAPLVQLGSYLLRLDRVGDAIARLEEAIQIKATDLDAHELLGEAYYRDNDIPSARAQWDYVLQMDPNRTTLKERYAKAFREESVESDFNRSGSRHFKISYPKSTPYAARGRVLNILESAYWDIGRKFNGVYPPPPIQVIVYDAEQFTEATHLDMNVGAVYDGKIRTPLMDKTGDMLPDTELKRRLTHEYVHVVVRNLTNDRVPWWLNEGLAEHLSRPIEGTEADLLHKMYADGAAFHLAELEGHQLKVLPPDQLRAAYAQAHATVAVLWGRFGQAKMAAFLRDLASGEKPEDAIRQTYQRGYAKIEQEVANVYR
jgi:tetratricopeptide (TPR) repeat protein